MGRYLGYMVVPFSGGATPLGHLAGLPSPKIPFFQIFAKNFLTSQILTHKLAQMCNYM